MADLPESKTLFLGRRKRGSYLLKMFMNILGSGVPISFKRECSLRMLRGQFDCEGD